MRRKGKPVGNTFGEGFFWAEIIDAASDVYNGVNYTSRSLVSCVTDNGL